MFINYYYHNMFYLWYIISTAILMFVSLIPDWEQPEGQPLRQSHQKGDYLNEH